MKKEKIDPPKNNRDLSPNYPFEKGKFQGQQIRFPWYNSHFKISR